MAKVPVTAASEHGATREIARALSPAAAVPAGRPAPPRPCGPPKIPLAAGVADRLTASGRLPAITGRRG